jgi:NitT/TauT family transport system substrate-binding protein
MMHRFHHLTGFVIVTLLSIATAASAEEVRVGVVGSASDGTFFIADAKGYFRDEGLSVAFVNFANVGEMLPALGTDQLEVGSGAPSAGLYNAVARGIDIKVVADKGSMPPGYGYMPLLVRKDLIESGRVKTLADLKGLKIGSPQQGGANVATLNEALREGGLSWGDVDAVYMGHMQLAFALENQALDAALVAEPNASLALKSGKVVRFVPGDQIYPNQQLAVVVYGGGFTRKAPEAARKFMVAYLRAARDYNDAIASGHLTGPKGDEIIAILTRYTTLKDAALYREMVPNGVDPDGRVNIASMEKDHEFIAKLGLLKGESSVKDIVDPSFAAAAVERLGPYRRKPGESKSGMK